MTGRIHALATVQVENEFTRVTEWRFKPGTETGQHRHGCNYAVVPMTDGILLIETSEGTRTRTLVAGQAYSGVTGNEHNVVNGGDADVVFIEIEMLRDR